MTQRLTPAAARRRRRPARSRRGAAAILAMMFLVIFGSLATAMAVVSQGNLNTADSQLKVQRSLAAAETGLNFLAYRIEQVASGINTSAGLIYDPRYTSYSVGSVDTGGSALDLWVTLRNELRSELGTDSQYTLGEITVDADGSLILPLAQVGPNAPSFSAVLSQHPLVGENYNGDRYQQPPYSTMDPPVSNADPLDGTWIRVAVTAQDGVGTRAVPRTISVDFKLDKRIRYAIMSQSRVMIGRNVMIEGPIGSGYDEIDGDNATITSEDWVPNGHPVVMLSDFSGMDASLDAKLDLLTDWLIGGTDAGGDPYGDIDGDNRIAVNTPAEVGTLDDPATPVNEAADLDANGDGYIDDYDLFLDHYGTFNSATGQLQITTAELESGGVSTLDAQQLVDLIDTFRPDRNGDGVVDSLDTLLGYGDGVIDSNDRYAKVRGEVHISAQQAAWNNGADENDYHNHYAGSVVPGFEENATTFESAENERFNIDASNFDTTYFADLTSAPEQELGAQAATQPPADPDAGLDPRIDGEVTEEVPFGSPYPYDFYTRTVYRDMTFVDVRIPKGANALFVNCTFDGVTYIEGNDALANQFDFNYAGMTEADGSQKHPDKYVLIDPDGDPDDEANKIYDTKAESNNLRFHDCTFLGPVVTGTPSGFSQVRNKLTFTGNVQFDVDASPTLSDEEKRIYKRSTLLAPNYSVEMGTFVAPYETTETINLDGAVVAGLIDMRGKVSVNGSVIATFKPQANTGPVLGDLAPQFNTTLGYFSAADGDLEAELPTAGLGIIHLRYDPSIPLPDGIVGPIELRPVMATYRETATQ
ncbi:MAG: hypothetical protein AAGI54_07495 [Planctomycetota bacterium]